MSIIFLAWEILFTGIAKKMVYFFLNVGCALFLQKYRKLFVYAGAKVFFNQQINAGKKLAWVLEQENESLELQNNAFT